MYTLKIKFMEYFKSTYVQISGECDIAHVNGSWAVPMGVLHRNLDNLQK